MADQLSYDFLPWARRGLARAHAAQQALGQPVLPKIRVGLQITGDGAQTDQGGVDLKVLGPADIVGIDPRTVVRTEPRANLRNFEPNYLAAIDFDPPDLPWLMTPAHADAQQRLSPWLALIVLRRDEVEGRPLLRPGRLLASVLLRAAPAVPLPNLAEGWMWAHAQLLRSSAAQTVQDGLRNNPAHNLSRLVCPRRLEPGVDYFACVVPAFDAGVKAGLGQPVASDALLGPAWAGSEAAGIELPIYYHWEFSTGPAGDFETLARRLKTKNELPAEVQQKIGELGRVPVEVDADRLLQRGAVTPQIVQQQYVARYEGALLSLSPNPAPEPGRVDDIAELLRTVLTTGDRRALGNLAQLDSHPEVPLVGPPAYGVWHARRHDLEVAHRKDRWLEGLNLSVPNRMAGGVGTRLVQTNQEEFMQSAWSQVGDVLKAERLLSRLHLSAKALAQLVLRIDKLPPLRQLQLLAPAAGRMKFDALAPGLTMWGYRRGTSLPDAALDGALRRGFSAVRGMVRHAPSRVASGIATQLVAAFAEPRSARSLVEFERFRVDGIASLRALDALQLPSDPGALVAVPGFVEPLRVDQVRVLQGLQGQVSEVLQPGAWHTPSVTQKLRGGVLLDSHWERIGEFASALSQDQIAQPQAAGGGVTAGATVLATPQTAMAHTVFEASPTRPEGVLLSAVRGEAGFQLAAAQGLRVDARNGNLAVGKALTRSRRGAAPVERAAAMRPGQVAAVDITAIRRLGNTALFNSLPPSAVQPAGPGAVPAVALQATPGGLFKPVRPNEEAPARPGQLGDRHSITLLPPERSQAVLDIYRVAWQDKIQRDAPTLLPPRVTVAVVPFEATRAAQTARAALDIATLVPQRVSSLIDLGDSRLDLLHPSPGLVSAVHAGLEKYVVTALLDRVMAYPRLDEALYKRLVDMDRDAFMPGVEDIPNDTILLVATNPRFVESFLVGSNHEMNRELLWRGFPTDQRGTPFQKFWPYFDPGWVDVQPIHQWSQGKAIGSAGGGQGQKARLALLVRGALLQRFPNTNIYAVEKGNDSAPAFSGLSTPPPPAPPVLRKTLHPIGGGALPPDITFFLFDIAPDDAAKYWWVLEEPMTEPRFGFDDQEQPREVPRLRARGSGNTRRLEHATRFGGINLLAGPQALAGETWLDVDWSELQPPVAAGRHLSLAQLRSVQLATAGLAVGADAHAAQVARALLQRPFRGYFAGERLES
ncbi:hypothetical protein [Methylibium sp.]|uniref:hypothetical protein n=1 Tax=Methylibium sp. TaxID=2067992 RepID=UPI003D0B426B